MYTEEYRRKEKKPAYNRWDTRGAPKMAFLVTSSYGVLNLIAAQTGLREEKKRYRRNNLVTQ